MHCQAWELGVAISQVAGGWRQSEAMPQKAEAQPQGPATLELNPGKANRPALPSSLQPDRRTST